MAKTPRCIDPVILIYRVVRISDMNSSLARTSFKNAICENIRGSLLACQPLRYYVGGRGGLLGFQGRGRMKCWRSNSRVLELSAPNSKSDRV